MWFNGWSGESRSCSSGHHSVRRKSTPNAIEHRKRQAATASSRSSTQVALTKLIATNVMSWIAAVTLSLCVVGANQDLPEALSDAQINDALRLAQDDKAAQALLDVYTLQTRTGIGAGPLVGRLSTPFSRVVLAAVAARRAGQSFIRDDVPSEILRPEILVIATPQPAANSDATMLAKPRDVAVAKREGNQVTDVLLPLRVRSATSEERKLYDLGSTPGVIVASFSEDALAPLFDTRTFNFVVRVNFDRVAKGSTPLTACKECTVPISPRIR
jgi:hypothetical protein